MLYSMNHGCRYVRPRFRLLSNVYLLHCFRRKLYCLYSAGLHVDHVHTLILGIVFILFKFLAKLILNHLLLRVISAEICSQGYKIYMF